MQADSLYPVSSSKQSVLATATKSQPILSTYVLENILCKSCHHGISSVLRLVISLCLNTTQLFSFILVISVKDGLEMLIRRVGIDRNAEQMVILIYFGSGFI